MTIVSTDFRPKRARKRKHPVAVPARIVSAKKPGPATPAIDEAATERKRPTQPAAITGPRIVTAKPPGRKPHIGAAARDEDVDEAALERARGAPQAGAEAAVQVLAGRPQPNRSRALSALFLTL